jgi:hypothetical protein
MEEQAIDAIKLLSMGVEALGFDLSDETKEALDFHLT